MRGVLQRVKSASVVVGKQKISQIGTGILLLLGIADTDTEKDVAYIREKTLNMRIFPDGNGKLNLSLKEAGGSVLLVSQFTLYGDVRKGRRPSFSRAAGSAYSKPLYEAACRYFEQHGVLLQTGEFGADMQVELINDGPVTILVDSERMF